MIPSTPSAGNLVSALNSGVKIVQVNLYDFNWFLKNSELREVSKLSGREVKRAAEITRKVKEEAFNARKAAEAARQTTDAIKAGNWQKVGGKGGATFIKVINIATTVAAWFGAILGLANSQAIKDIVDVNENIFNAYNAEANQRLRLISKISSRVTALEKQTKINDSNQQVTGLRAQQAFTNSVRARELANDALYEVRQGRVKLEAKIADTNAKYNKFVLDMGVRFAKLQVQFQTQYNNLANQLRNNTGSNGSNGSNANQGVIQQLQNQIINANKLIDNLTTRVNQALRPQQPQQPQQISQTTINQIAQQAATIVRPEIVQIRSENQIIKVNLEGFKNVQGSINNALKSANDNLAQGVTNVAENLVNFKNSVLKDIQALRRAINRPELQMVDSLARSGVANLVRENAAQQNQINQIEQQNKLQNTKINQIEQQNKLQDTKINEQNIMNQQGLTLLGGITATLASFDFKLNQLQQNTSAIVPAINQIPDKVGDAIIPEIVPNVDTAICNSVSTGCLNQMQNNITRLFPTPITPGDIQNAINNAMAGNLAANFPPINGSIDCHDCVTGTTVPLPYGGLGLYGLQSQIEQVSNQIETISKAICRTYRILGGNRWFTGASDAEVNFKVDPETEIKKKVKLSYRESASPQADIQTQTVQASSLPDLLYTINAASWRRQGLHKLPVEAPPTMFHPNITRNPVNGEIVSMQDWQPLQYVKIPDLISYDTYQLAQFKSVFGEFPISFDAEIEENGKIVKKKVVVDNIPDALNELMGVGLTLQDDLEINTQLGIKTATELLACKNSSLITQDICLANMKYLGYQVNRKSKTIPVLFTPGTQNVFDFLKDSKQNIISYEHRSGHLEFRLNTLEVSAGITKAALTRYPTDELPGSIIAKDALAKIKAKDEDWEQFLKMINNPTGDLKVDDAPQPIVEDITARTKNDLEKLD